MTEHVFQQLVFHFRNGDKWTISHKQLADIWIDRVTTSYGRIDGGHIQEIHPCKSFKAEILPEANHVKAVDVNTGSLERGMFGRALKYQDIERMDLQLDKAGSNVLHIYVPFAAKDSSGVTNRYQTTKLSAKNGHLYIVIDAAHTVDDEYPNY